MLRLVTVHPILTHFTIGVIPILVLAYAMAYLRRSEKWTFAGDATLVLTALITVVTAGFGLVSFFVLEWPGGLGTWRWLHLGFGAGTAALFAAFAIARLVGRRRRGPLSGAGALLSAAGLALVVTFTGWLGGEVLVYRAGMAVTAAGDGALAPPITGTGEEPPASVEAAMHRLRGHWGATHGALAHMIAEEPAPESFERIARHADEMARVAEWTVGGGEGRAGAGQSQSQLAPMAGLLSDQARSLAEAARAQDIVQVTSAAGKVSSTCAGCHKQFRWGQAHQH